MVTVCEWKGWMSKVLKSSRVQWWPSHQRLLSTFYFSSRGRIVRRRHSLRLHGTLYVAQHDARSLITCWLCRLRRRVSITRVQPSEHLTLSTVPSSEYSSSSAWPARQPTIYLISVDDLKIQIEFQVVLCTSVCNRWLDAMQRWKATLPYSLLPVTIFPFLVAGFPYLHFS